MVRFDALVQQCVKGEGEQGGEERIPRGHCRVQSRQGFVSVSWHEDERERHALLSASRFERCLEAGTIVIVDAAQIHE